LARRRPSPGRHLIVSRRDARRDCWHVALEQAEPQTTLEALRSLEGELAAAFTTTSETIRRFIPTKPELVS
jgi:hypothetical protein